MRAEAVEQLGQFSVSGDAFKKAYRLKPVI
jgi:hypothetical protein